MIDSSYAWLAAKYIRRQAKQLARQFDGVRTAADAEFIHRARVACRRLRAALRMFDKLFPHKRLRQWDKAIRRTAAILGDVRDHDVQIEFLCSTQSALSAKECCLGVARVLVELERGRERLQPSVVAAVDRLESKRVLRQLRRAAEALQNGAGSSVENAPSPAAQVKARQHMLRRLDKLLQRAGSLADADDQQGHHAMRIAAKRLRYTVEIARPVFPGRLDETLECMKKVQSLLGDVHDCDVWAGQLDAFSARQCGRITRLFGNQGRMARLQPGIDYLRRDRRRRREETFEQLVKYWAELEYHRLWEDLRSIVGGKSPAVTDAEPPVGQAVAVGQAVPDVPSSQTVPDASSSQAQPDLHQGKLPEAVNRPDPCSAPTPGTPQPPEEPPVDHSHEEDRTSPQPHLTVGSG